MNDHVDELLALYALGGLEPDELKQVEAHLAGCAACRQEADRQWALVSALATSVPPHAPRPEIRAALLKRIQASGPQRATTRRRMPFAGTQGRSRARTTPAWVSVAFGAALVLALAWNIYLSRELDTLRQQVSRQQDFVVMISSPDTQVVDLEGQGELEAANGRAYVDQSTQEVVLVVQRLRPLQSDQTYQAWLITGAGPVSAGLFAVDELGNGITTLAVPYSPGSAVGVSLEPAGGSEQPTEVVLLGGL